MVSQGNFGVDGDAAIGRHAVPQRGKNACKVHKGSQGGYPKRIHFISPLEIITGRCKDEKLNP